MASQSATKTVVPKRGEVWLVNFDPTQGAEIKKTRPALILQNDVANRYSPITIVAPITSKLGKPYPTEVLLQVPEGGLAVDSVAQLNQVRAIDKLRLRKRLGMLKGPTMTQVEQALLVSFGLEDLGRIHAFLKQHGLSPGDLLSNQGTK